MDISPEAWELIGRYLGAGFALGLGGIGAAIGMGMAAGQANEGIMRQPEQHGYMLRTMLIGQAVGGSPSIFALVVGLVILMVPAVGAGATGFALAAALTGAGLSIGLGAFGSGVGCGWPAGTGCDGVARNPDESTLVTSRMLIGQAMAQTPSIFAIVISLLLLFTRVPGGDWAVLGICLGAGVAMGASALGPGIGSGMTAGGAITGMGRFPKNHGIVLRTMLIGQAICQTPAILGMLVAFIMIFTLDDLQNDVIGFAKTFGAGIAVGFGGVGPGIGSGSAGDSACLVTAARPRLDSLQIRTMLIGQAVAQSTAIYSFIIALMLLYVV